MKKLRDWLLPLLVLGGGPVTLVPGLAVAEGVSVKLEPGSVFSDCDGCPAMVVVPPGSLTMGYEGGEEGRYEGPVREVQIVRPFAVGQFPVTNADYQRFSESTGRKASLGCNYYDFEQQKLINLPDTSWRRPGRPIRDEQPVVCVSWTDSKAYVEWLSQQTGATYRLLSEAEWEYLARDGSDTKYPWGDDPNESCAYANFPDISMTETFGLTTRSQVTCSDGYPGIAPVDAFPPNGFGVYDMIGNSWEWTEDCYLVPYPDGPLDGSAVQVEGECDRRAVRGGAWISDPFRQRPSWRGRDPEGKLTFIFGFRVARDLP
jgi:formylglycine-generating enzyme required for sulfatase activity